MQSMMLRRFYAYGLLCRLGGCFFIQNFDRHSLEKARISWKSPYTLYSVTCVLFSFGFFIWFETVFLIKQANTVSDLSSLFSETLSLTLHVVVSFKIFTNFISVVTGSSQLLDFFKTAASFEEATGFATCQCCLQAPRSRGWSVLRRALVTVALAVSFVVFIYFYVAHFADTMARELALASKIIGSIAALPLFLYDSLCYVVLRCCSGVLLDYIHAQFRAFQEGTKSKGVVRELRASRQLETIRLNLCSIRELTRSLNNIWKASLVGTCAGIILVACVVLHSMFHKGVFKREVWMTLAYSAYSLLAFIELVYISQAMMEETQKLKNAAQATRTSNASGHYAQELHYLHQSIDPEGMCLSGGEFFRLSKSLLVSMTASIITFTVILVQKSDEITSKMDAAGTHPAQ